MDSLESGVFLSFGREIFAVHLNPKEPLSKNKKQKKKNIFAANIDKASHLAAINIHEQCHPLFHGFCLFCPKAERGPGTKGPRIP
jgi:hypothetical protein